MRRFSVYTLSDPRDGAVRYVGVSVEPHKRYKAHLHPRNQSRQHGEWIASLLAEGLKPVLGIIATTESRDIARHTELATIKRYRAMGHNLNNCIQAGSIPSSNPVPQRKPKMLTRRGCLPGMRAPKF